MRMFRVLAVGLAFTALLLALAWVIGCNPGERRVEVKAFHLGRVQPDPISVGNNGVNIGLFAASISDPNLTRITWPPCRKIVDVLIQDRLLTPVAVAVYYHDWDCEVPPTETLPASYKIGETVSVKGQIFICESAWRGGKGKP